MKTVSKWAVGALMALEAIANMGCQHMPMPKQPKLASTAVEYRTILKDTYDCLAQKSPLFVCRVRMSTVSDADLTALGSTSKSVLDDLSLAIGRYEQQKQAFSESEQREIRHGFYNIAVLMENRRKDEGVRAYFSQKKLKDQIIAQVETDYARLYNGNADMTIARVEEHYRKLGIEITSAALCVTREIRAIVLKPSDAFLWAVSGHK